MINKNIILFFAFSLTGCAGTSIDSLKKDNDASGFVLKDKIEHHQQIANGWIDGLKPGAYKSVGYNKKGTFYLGPKFCKTEKQQIDIKDRSCDGGIFVPFNKDGKMHFFFIMGTCTDSGNIDNSAITQTSTNISGDYGAAGTAVGGLGAGLGNAIVGGMVAAEQGKMFWARDVEDQKIIEIIRMNINKK